MKISDINNKSDNTIMTISIKRGWGVEREAKMETCHEHVLTRPCKTYSTQMDTIVIG